MALVGPIFFDTSVLLSGLMELGPASEAAHRLMDAIAEHRLTRVCSAWHCCLEFYSVSTRLPPEFRLDPGDALKLIGEEILARFEIRDLPENARTQFLQNAQKERVAGGRIYDAHIAEIARWSNAKTVVTDNRRHFIALLRHGIAVLSAAEAAQEFRRKG